MRPPPYRRYPPGPQRAQRWARPRRRSGEHPVSVGAGHGRARRGLRPARSRSTGTSSQIVPMSRTSDGCRSIPGMATGANGSRAPESSYPPRGGRPAKRNRPSAPVVAVSSRASPTSGSAAADSVSSRPTMGSRVPYSRTRPRRVAATAGSAPPVVGRGRRPVPPESPSPGSAGCVAALSSAPPGPGWRRGPGPGPSATRRPSQPTAGSPGSPGAVLDAWCGAWRASLPPAAPESVPATALHGVTEHVPDPPGGHHLSLTLPGPARRTLRRTLRWTRRAAVRACSAQHCQERGFGEVPARRRRSRSGQPGVAQ